MGWDTGTWHRGLVLVLGLGLVVVAVGGAPTAPSTGHTPVPSSVRSLPIDDYLYSAAQVGVVEHARWLLAQDCMRTFGFTTWSPPPTEGTADALLADRRYGIAPNADPRSQGYRLVPPDARAATVAPAPLTPAEAEVLIGQSGSGQPVRFYQQRPVPAGGCAGSAEQRIADGGEYAHSNLAAQINIETFLRSKSDPTVQAAIRTWSACMRGAGYRYASPLDSVADPRWSTPTPTALEVRTATADLACTARTRLYRIWHDVEAGMQAVEIGRNRQQLNAERAARDRQLNHAHQIIAGR